MGLIELLQTSRRSVPIEESKGRKREKKRLLLRVPITLSNTVNERDENHIMVNSNHALHTVSSNI